MVLPPVLAIKRPWEGLKGPGNFEQSHADMDHKMGFFAKRLIYIPRRFVHVD